MSSPLPVLLVLLVVAAVVLILKRFAGRAEPYPYARKPALFTPVERSFLETLYQAMEQEYRVFGKVFVTDIAELQQGLSEKERLKAQEQIKNQCFDFVLCNKRDLSIACVIKLRDGSQQEREPQHSDAFLAGLCDSLLLPFVHVATPYSGSAAELRETILSAVNQRPEPLLLGPEAPAPEGQRQDRLAAPADPTLAQAAQDDLEPELHAPACPKCEAPMLLRRAQAGSIAGKFFWGCSDFPKCRGMVLELHQERLETTV